MEPEIFLATIFQSMQDSARQVRSSLGRPSSQATRQEALQQVAMLKAAKDENDALVNAKGFRDNWDGQGVNYISDRMALEDMHPANVFVDEVSGKPICIDCIVKFV